MHGVRVLNLRFSAWVKLGAVVLLVVMSMQSVSADELAIKGFEIAKELERRDSKFVDLQVDMEMILRSRRGRESSRDLSIRQIEIEDDGDRSLLIIKSPRALRGSAVLSHAHPSRDDDQWIYLPAVSRVKKIASNNKSGPFLGSDFAYEDLVHQELDKFTYTFVQDDTVGLTNYWVVARFPVDHYSGYSRQLTWYNQDEYRIEKIEYYDKHEKHLKTLTMTDFRMYENRFWKAHHMLMENVQTGNSTQMIWSNFGFKNNFLPNRDFTTTALKRTR